MSAAQPTSAEAGAAAETLAPPAAAEGEPAPASAKTLGELKSYYAYQVTLHEDLPRAGKCLSVKGHWLKKYPSKTKIPPKGEASISSATHEYEDSKGGINLLFFADQESCKADRELALKGDEI